MAMLPVILGMKQKCPACGQSSNPRVGQGDWEVMGVWNGSINRCTRCSRLIRVGFVTDQLLTEDDAGRFLASRAAHLQPAKRSGVDGEGNTGAVVAQTAEGDASEEGHPLHQLGTAMLEIWRNVNELQRNEPILLQGAGVAGWTSELAAADALSMALGIHFAPYSKDFRRYLMEYVKVGISSATNAGDIDDPFTAYLDAVGSAQATPHDTASGDVIAHCFLQRTAIDIVGLERKLSVRFGMLSSSARDLLGQAADSVSEPGDLPPAFQTIDGAE